jgi:iron(III) transport system permease protein
MSAIVRIGGRGSFPTALLFVAAIPALLVLVPIAYAAMRASEAGVWGIIDELRRPTTLQLLFNTLTLMVCVTVLSGALGVAAAWFTERSDLPYAPLWRIVASAPLAMPALVSSYAWSSLGPAFQTMPAAIAILTFACTPLIYLPTVAALRGVDPSFEEVARSLARGRGETFLRVVLPQIAPAIMGGALLVSSHMLAEFGALSFLRVQTFTTEIFQQYDEQFDNATAALLSSMLMAISMPLALAEMRVRRGRRFARSGKGVSRQPQIMVLGWRRVPIMLGFAAFAALALGAPFWMLFYWLANGASIGLGAERVLPALLGSLSYSLSGGVLVTLLALPLVLASMRLRGWAVVLAERLPYVIHGLPGLVIALALVFFAIRFTPALYQSPLIVLTAYVMLFLPLAQSAIRASAELVPPELEDVARTLGKSPLVAFIEVTLPNLLPGIGAAVALVVLQLMRELTATLLLAPSGVVTLATEFWSYTNDRAYAAAAPFAAALVIASGIPVYVFTLRTLQRGAYSAAMDS